MLESKIWLACFIKYTYNEFINKGYEITIGRRNVL